MNNSVVFEGDCNLTIPIDGDLETMVKVAGLEYETGVWTPGEATQSHTITFSRAHSTKPILFVAMCDVDEISWTNGATATGYFTIAEFIGKFIQIPKFYAFYDLFAVFHFIMNGYTTTRNSQLIYETVSAENIILTSYNAGDESLYVADVPYKWLAVWAPED